MLSQNVKITPMKKFNAWRKISLGSWKIIGDSQVYCELKVDVTKTLKYLEEKNKNSQEKMTITHYLGVVMGKILREVPQLNVLTRLGKIYYRDEVNIFFHIAQGKAELSGCTIKNIDHKNVEQVATELNKTAGKVRKGDDPSFKKIKGFWSFIPTSFSWVVLNFIEFLNYTLNINVKGMGIPKDSFGSMMITNIGSLGFDNAFVPLAPYTRCPLIFALGKIHWAPYCTDEGEIKARKEVSMCVTFDHRVIDGARGAMVANLVHEYFNHPEKLEGE